MMEQKRPLPLEYVSRMSSATEWRRGPAALALNLTPGVDMMFCLGQGLRAGPQQALAASAGISVGSMVHVALAGLGLGAAVTALPWLFDVIRWVGVIYLLWLALGAIRGGTVVLKKGDRLVGVESLRHNVIIQSNVM